MLSKEEACKEMRGGLPRKWKTFLWSQSFPPEHNIEYQWGSQYRGFSFKIFEKISKPVPVGVEYLNQVILVDGWKTWSSSFTFLFYCWSSSSQFHQPTCCFSSEAGNLSILAPDAMPKSRVLMLRNHKHDHCHHISEALHHHSLQRRKHGRPFSIICTYKNH